MKRWILAGLALLCAADGQAKWPIGGEQWTCALDNIADGYTLCALAPTPGMRRYITDIVAQSTSTTAGLFNLAHGKSVATGGSVNCGTDGSALFLAALQFIDAGRFEAAGNGGAATVIDFTTPISVPPGHDLCIQGDASNAVTVQVIGYLAP